MAGMNGMTVTNQAKAMSESVLSGSNLGVWATFKYIDEVLCGCAFDIKSDRLTSLDVWRGFTDELISVTDDVRYGLIDFAHKNRREQVTRSKRVFVMWAPKGASKRQK